MTYETILPTNETDRAAREITRLGEVLLGKIAHMGVENPRVNIEYHCEEGNTQPWMIYLAGSHGGYQLEQSISYSTYQYIHGTTLQDCLGKFHKWHTNAPTLTDQRFANYVRKLEEARALGEDIEQASGLKDLAIVAKLEQLIAETKDNLLAPPKVLVMDETSMSDEDLTKL